MSVKVEKTENKNEVKLEFTVEAKIFDEGIKTVFNKNTKYFIFLLILADCLSALHHFWGIFAECRKFCQPKLFYEKARLI